MTRSKALSALVLAGAIGGLSVAQPPPTATESPKAPPAATGKTKTDPPAQPTPFNEVVVFTYPNPPADPVAEAMRNHPDVRVAEAKMRVAEAELAQAKLLVAQRVAAAQAKVQAAQAAIGPATRSFQRMEQLRKAGNIAQEDFEKAEKELAQTRSAVAAAEADLKVAQGVTPGQSQVSFSTNPVTIHDVSGAKGVVWLNDLVFEQHKSDVRLNLNGAKPAPGSAADKLRELIDKPVTLDEKSAPFSKVMADFIGTSGLNAVVVRYPEWADVAQLKYPPKVGPLSGTQTVATWVELIVDDFNRSVAQFDSVPQSDRGKYDAYVRDYGVLITKVDLAPPGAVTLSEFARRVRNAKSFNEKAAKPKP